MLVKRLAAYTHLSSTISEIGYSKLLVKNCDIFIPHLQGFLYSSTGGGSLGFGLIGIG